MTGRAEQKSETRDARASREERDARVDSRYTLSPTLRAIVGEHHDRSILATIVANMAEIVEVYQAEAGREPHARLDESVTLWLRRQLGAEPEKLVVELIRFEVRRRMNGRTHHELFATYAEEQRWERATRTIVESPEFDDLAFEQRLGLIVAAAGEKLGSGLRSMPLAKLAKPMPKPRRYMSEDEYNRRMDELREQRKRIADDEIGGDRDSR